MADSLEKSTVIVYIVSIVDMCVNNEEYPEMQHCIT